MELTYTDYLKLNKLLSLQNPLSPGPKHDEMLFIVIHQTYELWFKEILFELDDLKLRFQRLEVPQVLHRLKRVLSIMKTLVGQMDILETMTPSEFKSFRDYLGTASGFQSFQFREVEFVLGAKDASVLEAFDAGSVEQAKLENRLKEKSVWDGFLGMLKERGYGVPEEALNRDVTQKVESCDEIRKILIEVYGKDPELSMVCERLIDLDEGLQEWRYRHLKMVERMIGNLIGTGGSSGANYLRKTLEKSAFPDLWSIRGEL